MNRLILAQGATILAAVALGAIVGPQRAVGVALAAYLVLVGLGLARNGMWRLP